MQQTWIVEWPMWVLHVGYVYGNLFLFYVILPNLLAYKMEDKYLRFIHHFYPSWYLSWILRADVETLGEDKG